MARFPLSALLSMDLGDLDHEPHHEISEERIQRANKIINGLPKEFANQYRKRMERACATGNPEKVMAVTESVIKLHDRRIKRHH